MNTRNNHTVVTHIYTLLLFFLTGMTISKAHSDEFEHNWKDYFDEQIGKKMPELL